MSDAIYRVQDVKKAKQGYGSVNVRMAPVSLTAAEEKLEVGNYIVMHKYNGPSEKCE
jgi:hypothetical protein